MIESGIIPLASTPVSLPRRTAELLLGRVTLKRRLPSEAGGAVLFVSGRVGGMRYLLKPCRSWDPQLLRIAALLVKRGACIWDVGANVGLFSRAAAFHAGSNGTVVALEADSDAATLLRHSCRYREENHAKISVVPVAISDRCGFVTFDIAKRSRSSNAIHGFGSTQTGGVIESRILPSVTLDSVLGHFRPPDVLKIDVEGAELDVLNGGQRTLAEARPLIYCEVQGNTCLHVSKMLDELKYRVWDGHAFGTNAGNTNPSVQTCDILAIPVEKLGQIDLAHG